MLKDILNWAVDRVDEITINLSTELVGVVVSVFLSLYFANYLDKQSEKRRARARISRMHRVLKRQYQFLTDEIFSDASYNVDNVEPWGIRVAFIRDAEEMYLESNRVIEAIEVEYIDYFDGALVDCFKKVKQISRNNSVCLRLQSGTMQELVKRSAPKSEIVEQHANWITHNLVRMKKILEELQSSFRYIRTEKLQEIDMEELRNKYRVLFAHAIPDGEISMKDFFT